MKAGVVSVAGLIALVAAVGLGAGTASAFDNCGIANGWNVGISDVVTCGFAFNVARGVNPSSRGGEIAVTAYSPTTGANYSVTCHDARQQSTYAAAYECSIWSPRGGAVYLFQ